MQDLENKVVQNLIPDEPVTILRVKQMGEDVGLTFFGNNSNKRQTLVLTPEEIAGLEVITEEGQFNFTGDAKAFSLFVEAERIHSAYQFDPLFAVNCSVVDPLPHQVEAVYKNLLPLPRIRFLLADDTGAGKTIMAGLLLKELMIRGIAERILIITPGGLTKQWQEDELQLKFNLSFELVNRERFTSDPNIFNNADRVVTSIDFLSREEIINNAAETEWDMIIVDEAHKLSAYESGSRLYESLRYKAVERMSSKCEHLLLLTATPHRGRKDTFRKLLQLLDEDIFANDALVDERINQLGKNGANKFFIRRLKEEMKDWNDKALFRSRSTKTVKYELTNKEKRLYNKVTEYLEEQREKAEGNIHVSLTLMVMQRRLTSSIFAIMRTLGNRYAALKDVLTVIQRQPDLFKQRHKFETVQADTLNDYDELDDEDREELESILSDAKRFKLFTTASSPQEIKDEAEEVKALHLQAKELYDDGTEEQKLTKLYNLLQSEGVMDGKEKLVIFTEHKDTLYYLEEKLATNGGFTVATIHGSKNVDERREAQDHFRNDAQILLATDAAGEGINLQFCRLLINWDIPWNPNRLEQRMGRIHRYGQEDDVLVFNLVASNTREGAVMERLLTKLDTIREQLGDDRVYDVISDVFENVKLEEFARAVFFGDKNEALEKLEVPADQLKIDFQNKINDKQNTIGYSSINYKEAERLMTKSQEERLQPTYIREFFEMAFADLGGKMKEVGDDVFHISKLPEEVDRIIRKGYKMSTDLESHFCFDKKVFLDAHRSARYRKLHYINPGNPIFDSVLRVIRERYKEEAMKGTILVSPDETKPYFAFLTKSKIADSRYTAADESLADARINLVAHDKSANVFTRTSPARFLDFSPPLDFAKDVVVPEPVDDEAVSGWVYQHITVPQYNEVSTRVKEDAAERKRFLIKSFDDLSFDLNREINDLQFQVSQGKKRAPAKLAKRMDAIVKLGQRKTDRLDKLDQMMSLSKREPEILGCAYIVPLTELEYQNFYEKDRDFNTEDTAMDVSMKYEVSQGRRPEDVGSQNLGYDIRSTDKLFKQRYIEVKGRKGSDGQVFLTRNELFKLRQLGEKAYLYVVINCETDNPDLFIVHDPGSVLHPIEVPAGVRYKVTMQDWQRTAQRIG
ncbi:helicase-related protein [Lewinella sp. 4G2]|uniref:helicase-related protein n=1 Tax=Lewinella sp. 4G2 TaxID=1803372 RepID=UPI0007B4BBF4|nr:helicase-related protein [Lewinella sp. 4G2]OAV44064.1 helicase [Lewinella sp. 4G2]